MNALTTPPEQIEQFLQNCTLPTSDSHKGQNGKLLLIGGSELFHAASKWSLDVASKFVDMVFYSSVPSNNQLIMQAKAEFWNGIVIERDEIANYIAEANCILVGPGMTRTPDTQEVVNQLLGQYPDKKWVIDAGALQMVNPQLLKASTIITPHQKELEMLVEHGFDADDFTGVMVLKGPVDVVTNQQEKIEVVGGNAGMTKGGTGDVLAGLIAALYCTNDAMTATVVGSFLNKKAGEFLYEQVGPFFNASDLVEAVPRVAWQYLELKAA